MSLPSPANLIPDLEERVKEGGGGSRTDERSTWNKAEDFFVSYGGGWVGWGEGQGRGEPLRSGHHETSHF